MSDSPYKMYGIYDVSQDTLKLCYTSDKPSTRPLEFRTTPGSGTRYVVFKRSAEKAEDAQKPKENSAKKEDKNPIDMKEEPAKSEAEAYSQRAEMYAKKQEFERAVIEATEAIRLDAKFAKAYAIRANVYLIKGDYDRAIADASVAIRLDAKCVRAYYSRATSLLHKKDVDRAISDATEAIRLNPKHFPSYRTRAEAYGKKKEFDNAIKDATEAIRLNAKHAPAYRTRGVAFLQKGDFSSAIADLSEALRLEPDSIYAKTNLESAKKGELFAKTLQEQSERVIGTYHMLVPAGIIKVEFNETHKFINGKELGSWSVKDGKVLIEFGLGWSELSFTDKDTLVGVRRYASKNAIGYIPQLDVKYVREGTEAAAELAIRAKREAAEREKADKERLEALARQREAAKRLTADELGKLDFTEIKHRIGEPTEIARSTKRRNVGLAIWITGDDKTIVVSFMDSIDGSKVTILTRHVNPSKDDAERLLKFLNEPEPLPKDARKLEARIKTVSKDDLDQAFTQHLQNLSVSATKNQIVLDFDVDRKNWQPVVQSFSLVVRVFDKDGIYLTHFVTKESFTASPDVYGKWMIVVNRLKGLPPQAQAGLLGGFTPKLLEAKGNRLVYGVNPAFLQYGAIVEVGFLQRRGGPF